MCGVKGGGYVGMCGAKGVDMWAYVGLRGADMWGCVGLRGADSRWLAMIARRAASRFLQMYHSVDEITENEIGGACGTYGVRRGAYSVWWGSAGERNLGVDR
jgi:hypothetical protein